MGANTSVDYLRLAGYGVPRAGTIATPTMLDATVVDVTSEIFGGTFDGVADDSDAWQAAVDQVAVTGGTVYMPPWVASVVGDITISSKYPVWIVSDMENHTVSGGVDNSAADYGVVRPAAGASFMFKWVLHEDIAATSFGVGGGGGVIGICFADITTAAATYRNVTLSGAAVWVEDAIEFTVDCCEFQYLVGTAIRVDRCNYSKHRNSKFFFCGDLDNTKPVIACGDDDVVAFIWNDRLFIENNYYTHIYVGLNGGLDHVGCYHENSGGTAEVTFIDATTGAITVHNCAFNNTTGTSIIVGGDTSLGVGSAIRNSKFNNFPAANSTIKVLTDSVYTMLSDLQIGAAGQTGPVIEIDAADCTLDNIYTLAGGPIKIDGDRCNLSNIKRRAPGGTDAQYAIDLVGLGCTLNGAHINGFDISVCNGIRVAAGKVNAAVVTTMDDGDGIVSTGASCITNCDVIDIGTGVPYTFANGQCAQGNTGYDYSTASDGNTDDVIVCNAESATLTTKALTTAAGAVYSFTWQNSLISSGSHIVASAGWGSATAGLPITVNMGNPGAGSVVLAVMNVHSADAFDGTIKVRATVKNG
jgi:hypothetical protein